MFEYINSFALKYFWLDFSGIFFAQYLAYILVAVVFLFLIYNFRRYWRMAVEVCISAVLARLIVEIVRWFWYHPRPFVENNVNLILPYNATSSFPSGHAAFFFALSCSVYFYNKKAGILFFIASFFIVLARVFVGIHWPLDILAGILVGIISAWFVNFLLNKFFHQQS